MSDLKTTLKFFVTKLLIHPVCVGNAILLAATTGIEQAFEKVIFKCPNDLAENKQYALLSVLLPAAALWILGILGNTLAKRLCQGLKYRKESQDCGCFCPCCFNLTFILLRTIIIPVVWVLVSLMDGHFYMCYFWRPACPSNSTNKVMEGEEPCTTNLEAWDQSNKAYSQMYGWFVLAGSLVITLIALFSYRYCSRWTYYSEIFANELKDAEILQMQKFLKEEAQKEAEINAGALMTVKKYLSAIDWELVCREYTRTEIRVDPQDQPKAKPEKRGQTEENRNPGENQLYEASCSDVPNIPLEEVVSEAAASLDGGEKEKPKPIIDALLHSSIRELLLNKHKGALEDYERKLAKQKEEAEQTKKKKNLSKKKLRA